MRSYNLRNDIKESSIQTSSLFSLLTDIVEEFCSLAALTSFKQNIRLFKKFSAFATIDTNVWFAFNEIRRNK